jgi:2-polyprenyl-3-methyl-5-hydroxy-6-metoxy-1,4-benzoquinol methylase
MSDKKLSAEEAYEKGVGDQFLVPEISLGPWTSNSLLTDPKHLAFVMGRYKFVAKMIEGRKSALEIGPGDGIGLPMMAQAVEKLHTVDWDQRLIEGNKRRLSAFTNIEHICLDLNKQALNLKVDAVYSVDVIEHLEPENEEQFMLHSVSCLNADGIILTGTPNVTASQYASPQSEAQHINLKSHKELRELTAKYFKNVFMFGMNDEVLHTGYGPMCHYIWALGVGVKDEYL